jgi:hypothetical protein
MKYVRQGSPDDLAEVGPLVTVVLSPPESITSQLRGPVPTLREQLIVDTGATRCQIDERKLQALGLFPIRRGKVIGVTLVPEEYSIYRVNLGLPVQEEGQRAIIEMTLDVYSMAAIADTRPFCGLLGRDFLRLVDFLYIGPSGRIEISLRPSRILS